MMVKHQFIELSRMIIFEQNTLLKQLKQLWLYGNPMPREELILIEQALPKCEVFI